MEILRFAPSPTNQNEDPNERGLHIGGLRTALFNYVIRSQKKDNVYVLRLEDTDSERSNDDCLRCIIRDFQWAGIKFDAGFRLEDNNIVEFNKTPLNFGPLRQSKRIDIYNKYIDILLEKQMAYKKDGAVFFHMPKNDVSFKDEILGTLTLPGKDCEDFVIRKSSGMPSFYFAMTIDDETMGITTIIRGQEHINSAYRQIALQKALDFRTIKMAHIPLIMNQDGSKMSKRQTTGQVNVNDFRKSGYLPEVLLTYIASLGWGFGENKEQFSIKEMIEKFKISDINKANCKFDYKKLLNFNSSALSKLGFEEFTKIIDQFQFDHFDNSFDYGLEKKKIEFVDFALAYHNRTKTLLEPFDNGKFFVNEEIIYNIEDIDKFLSSNNNEGINLLGDYLYHKLMYVQHWNRETLTANLNAYVNAKGLRLVKIAQPLRVAITGTSISPPIDHIMSILGKDECVRRITKCIGGILNKLDLVGVN